MQHDKHSHLLKKMECIHFKNLSCLWLSFSMLMTFFLSHRLICNAFHGKKNLLTLMNILLLLEKICQQDGKNCQTTKTKNSSLDKNFRT